MPNNVFNLNTGYSGDKPEVMFLEFDAPNYSMVGVSAIVIGEELIMTAIDKPVILNPYLSNPFILKSKDVEVMSQKIANAYGTKMRSWEITDLTLQEYVTAHQSQSILQGTKSLYYEFDIPHLANWLARLYQTPNSGVKPQPFSHYYKTYLQQPGLNTIGSGMPLPLEPQRFEAEHRRELETDSNVLAMYVFTEENAQEVATFANVELTDKVRQRLSSELREKDIDFKTEIKQLIRVSALDLQRIESGDDEFTPIPNPELQQKVFYLMNSKNVIFQSILTAGELRGLLISASCRASDENIDRLMPEIKRLATQHRNRCRDRIATLFQSEFPKNNQPS